MSIKPYRKIVASTGKYTDKNGDEKTRWQNCGTLFQKENGEFSIKLEALPIGKEWDGWLNLFPIDEKKKEIKLSDDVPGF